MSDVDEVTKQAECDTQVQLGLTVPSLQMIRPETPQELDTPPRLEQQPGHAVYAAFEYNRQSQMAKVVTSLIVVISTEFLKC